MASRYFATVRRAMPMPASRSFSTIVSSDNTSAALSASISCLMRWRTASAECASPPLAAAIAEVKKYFSSKMPRLVAMYLLAVTRDTVDFVHADGFRNRLEVERAQVLDAMRKERVLLADDFVRDLEDGAGALVERAHEPCGALQALGKIRFLRVTARGCRNLGIIALIDQNLRQRVRVELDKPGAVGRRPHKDIRHDRLHDRRTECQAGLRIEAADFRDHVGEILIADAADFFQRGEIAPGEQIEPRDQRLGVFDARASAFSVAGDPDAAVPLARLAETERLLVRSVFSAPGPTFPFGTHVAVVEVDTETGKVTLRRMVTVDDAGTVVNPLLAEGQRHGGIAQGAAQAFLEEVVYDAEGNPLTTTFADYPFLSATEVPSFELADMATPTTYNPLGAKGIGEAGTIGATPAVQNAVVDAVATSASGTSTCPRPRSGCGGHSANRGMRSEGPAHGQRAGPVRRRGTAAAARALPAAAAGAAGRERRL